jgi:hypothetical protein
VLPPLEENELPPLAVPMGTPPPLPETVEPPDPELDVSLLLPQATTIIPKTRPDPIQTTVFREFAAIAFLRFVGTCRWVRLARDARQKNPGWCVGSLESRRHLQRRPGGVNHR